MTTALHSIACAKGGYTELFRSEMDSALYNNFREYKGLGDREQAKHFVAKFIDSFENSTERSTWVHSFLESGDYCHKIRHELYRDLIFPVLYQGYKNGDPWSLYFLAHTIQNVYDVRSLHEQLEWQTDHSLLVTCYQAAPDYRDVRVQLLARIYRSLDYGIHEWPSGLCLEIEDMESELSLAHRLDIENKHIQFFDKVEAILAEAKARKLLRDNL